MGIYINMEMPTRCGRCDMCITEADGDIDAHKECCITGAIIDNLGEKMEDCPLVPVLDHKGPLVDALEVINTFPEEFIFTNEQARALTNYIIPPQIENIKTEAEGEWIKMSDADGIYWACSVCGEDLPRISRFNPQFDLFPRYESIDKTRHCPSCGVKMKN